MRFQLALISLLLFAGVCGAQTTRPINQTLPTGWNAAASGPYTMGYTFYTTQSNVTVVEMGCCQNDAVAKTMWLWDSTATSTPIATITTAAASGTGQWRWGNLSTPVTLVANRN